MLTSRGVLPGISIPALICMAEEAVILSSEAEVAEWQSDDVWFIQQDRSHAETESEVQTIRTDNISGTTLAILCIK